ncbi:MAG: hypothetical protein J5562_04225 [Clostridia bacterium]|nr:hypothetical protein [Clostridia bacterium]
MESRTFPGYEDYYIEQFDNTSRWFYSLYPAWGDAEDYLNPGAEFEGTRLLIIDGDGRFFEPLSKKKNVFIDKPVYSALSGTIGLLSFDYGRGLIEMYEYKPGEKEAVILTSLPLEKGGDLINLRIEKEPFTLAKTEIHACLVRFIYPFEKTFELEKNETLFCLDGGRFITSKWIEDPVYREEIITRDLSDGKIISRERGHITEMPDGTVWKTVR